MAEYGIFSDESADYTEEEAVESGFYSKEEALAAIADRYSDDDELTVHLVEEPEDDDDLDDDQDELTDEDDNDSESYPTKY